MLTCRPPADKACRRKPASRNMLDKAVPGVFLSKLVRGTVPTTTWRKRHDEYRGKASFPARSLTDPRSRLSLELRHDADLLREGGEARVVLVGAQDRIAQQF